VLADILGHIRSVSFVAANMELPAAGYGRSAKFTTVRLSSARLAAAPRALKK
jgi:hypothetical protein